MTNREETVISGDLAGTVGFGAWLGRIMRAGRNLIPSFVFYGKELNPLSKKRKRARREKKRQARIELRRERAKPMTDSSDTHNDKSKSQDKAIHLPALTGISTGGIPVPAGQSKRQKLSTPVTYGRDLVRSVIAFLDKHSGAISAIATVVIGVLTYQYVTYSKKQWETMRDTLNMERPWIGPTERIMQFDSDTKQFRRVIWSLKNGGRSVATRVRPHLELKIGPEESPDASYPQVSACTKGQLPGEGYVVIPGIAGALVPVVPAPDVVGMLDKVHHGVELYLVGCVDYSDSTRQAWYRTEVREKFLSVTESFVQMPSGNDAR